MIETKTGQNTRDVDAVGLDQATGPETELSVAEQFALAKPVGVLSDKQIKQALDTIVLLGNHAESPEGTPTTKGSKTILELVGDGSLEGLFVKFPSLLVDMRREP